MRLAAYVMVAATVVAAWYYLIAALLILPLWMIELPVLWQAVILFVVLVGGMGTAYVVWVWVIERGWFDEE